MLKAVTITTLFLLSAIPGFAQPKFHNDLNFKYLSDSLLLNTGIKHPRFDTVNFEMRFWIRGLGNPDRKLFILQLNKESAWSLQQYHLCVRDSSYVILSKTDTLLNNWNAQWRKLLDNDILNLPGEKAGRKKWRSSKKEIVAVADGSVYVIELITKRSKRSYSYANPDTILRAYDLNNSDLVSINKIIETFTDTFKIHNTSSCGY